ncbi:MAG: hypothetical protein HYV16_10435 [Gammaproteobacteria bacterium]|nr:hypothetical protein [Gammaproteobacteria bacterium]
MHVQTQGLRELMPLRNQRSDADNTWYEIQAIAEADGGFTLWCGGQEFSPLEFGKELYPPWPATSSPCAAARCATRST